MAHNINNNRNRLTFENSSECNTFNFQTNTYYMYQLNAPHQLFYDCYKTIALAVVLQKNILYNMRQKR